jgi:hypothetical protein
MLNLFQHLSHKTLKQVQGDNAMFTPCPLW